MQFLVKDLQQDILCLTVFDRDFFSPNEFLGRSELRLADIIAGCEERRGPVIWIKGNITTSIWGGGGDYPYNPAFSIEILSQRL